LKKPLKPNKKIDSYPNLKEIKFQGQRINVLKYNTEKPCVYIIGYMEGCGSCNYMRRLIDKIMTPELQAKVDAYILDKRITDPNGFEFSGNPTILLVNKGKIIFQAGGVFNKIKEVIVHFFMR